MYKKIQNNKEKNIFGFNSFLVLNMICKVTMDKNI